MAQFRFKDRKTEELAAHLNEHSKAMDEKELFSFAAYDAGAGERGGYSGYSYWRSTIRAFRKNGVAMFFLLVILATLLLTFIEPLVPY